MNDVAGFVKENKELLGSVFDRIDDSQELLISRIREIAETPSPTFLEERRTAYLKSALAEAGLKDIHSLPKGSVLGFTRSKDDRDTLLLAAHIDTVFPMETDLTTRIEGSTLYGPGTGDNAANVAAIITLAEIFNDLSVGLRRNVAFCGTVGEEGIGNLGGMAEVLETFGQTLGTVIAVDGRTPSITNRSQAIRRYAVTVKGPGGHSWEHFGAPSAVHEMARLVCKLASLEVPTEPKTTFNVGTLHGGRSVNAIAQDCVAEVDLRSIESKNLEKLENDFLKIAKDVTVEGIQVKTELIGTRPAGVQPPESELVRTAIDTARHFGIEVKLTASSTDAALSLSKGIPSISFGTYEGKGTHTLEEQINLDSLSTGLKRLALTVLVLAGIEK